MRDRRAGEVSFREGKCLITILIVLAVLMLLGAVPAWL